MEYGFDNVKKVTKREIKENIAMHAMNSFPNASFVNDYDEVNEKPMYWRHSCPVIGVIVLEENEIILRDGVPVHYAFCSACGKVIYYIDIAY